MLYKLEVTYKVTAQTSELPVETACEKLKELLDLLSTKYPVHPETWLIKFVSGKETVVAGTIIAEEGDI